MPERAVFRREPRTLTFGTYQLVDESMNAIAWASWDSGRGFGLSLDDVEQYLTGRSVP